MSSTSTETGSISPGRGHLSTGTRGSRTVTSVTGRPGATTTIWSSARPYADETGGSETALTCAVPVTQARAPRRTTLTRPSVIDSASIATPSTTIAQLDRPSPKTITNTAMVPSTAATSLRAGAMGRPFWFATVDLPVVNRQARRHRP